MGITVHATSSNVLWVVREGLAEGERVIIVETSTEYTPPFSQNLTGIGGRTFVDIVMTRPRFAPQLCWSGIGCGA